MTPGEIRAWGAGSTRRTDPGWRVVVALDGETARFSGGQMELVLPSGWPKPGLDHANALTRPGVNP